MEQIDALLPQTQCGKCGYQSCHAYATALAAGESAINRCSPGGETTMEDLALLLKQPLLPLEVSRGAAPRPLRSAFPQVAFIEEADCIGCTKCLQACPVDAILGAAKRLHTVIAAECTGCELCITACPVDCMAMQPAKRMDDGSYLQQSDRDRMRQRFRARQERVHRQRKPTPDELVAGQYPKQSQSMAKPTSVPSAERSPLVLAAMQRAEELFAEQEQAKRNR